MEVNQETHTKVKKIEVEYNSAKWWQILLFSFNNYSTNMIFVLISAYFLLFAQSFLLLGAVLVGGIMTSMRLFDGFTDPLIGFLIDKTNTRFGKFRPWMVIGNLIIIFSAFAMFNIDPSLPSGTKMILLIGFYTIFILGYSMQTATTKGGGSIITNNPKQRPVLAMYYGILGGVILTTFMAYIPISSNKYELNMLDPQFWHDTALIASAFSFIFMILAVIGIWEKDVPENYLGFKSVKLKMSDFISIMRKNRAIQMLVIAAATDKLAFSMSGAVTVYFFANIMMNQTMSGIFSMTTLPAMFIFVGVATLIGRKKGQKSAFVSATWIALISSVIGLIFMPKVAGEYSTLSISIFFIAFWVQKGTSGTTGNFVITMISDCADYETYLSGRAVPGMMGTLFSFVDKMVSSLNGLIIGLMFGMFGLANTQIIPLTPADEYSGLVTIIAVGIFVMPILGYIASVLAMKYYPLDAEKMDEVQEVITLYKKNQSDPRSKE